MHRLLPIAVEVRGRSPASSRGRGQEGRHVSQLQRLSHLQGMCRYMLHEHTDQRVTYLIECIIPCSFGLTAQSRVIRHHLTCSSCEQGKGVAEGGWHLIPGGLLWEAGADAPVQVLVPDALPQRPLQGPAGLLQSRCRPAVTVPVLRAVLVCLEACISR